MSIERLELAGLLDQTGEDKKSVRRAYEEILTLALRSTQENPDVVDQNLLDLERSYRNREAMHFGESEHLSPVRASALYLMSSRIPPFYDAAGEATGNMAIALTDLGAGMAYIAEALVIAESVVHSGADKYVETYSSELSGIPPEDKPAYEEGLRNLGNTWAKRLQRYPDGIQFVKDELINMHLLMSGYDSSRSVSVKPHSLFTPINVRGGKFAVDMYQVVYPRAKAVFQPTAK